MNGRPSPVNNGRVASAPGSPGEQVRKLVESDEVLLVFNPLGTPSNTAIQKYLNAKKVPQLFVATGATKWGDPQNFPWTMGWAPTYQSESRVYAKYILQNHPNARIGILYQNDDYGKDYVKGLKDGLGAKASMIIAEAGYETTDPTIDSQIVKLKTSGADLFFDVATPKFAAQAIKKVAELGWKPVHILNNVSSSVGAVMKPAGFENSQGILSASYGKDPTEWKDDPAMKEWVAFMNKYYPEGNQQDASNAYGYNLAQTLVQVLKQCGDNLTRENVMKQAANLKDFPLGLLLPGIKINTSPTDFFPIEQLQMMRFDGNGWHLFGVPIDSELAPRRDVVLARYPVVAKVTENAAAEQPKRPAEPVNTAPERRVALVIGNGAYEAMPRLPNPANDATDMAAALRDLGFDVTFGLNLNRTEMVDKLITFAKAARQADAALVFYAGHGLQHQGINYLAPVDARITDEADLLKLVKVQELIDNLQSAKNAGILILDACRDNEAVKQLAASLPRNRAAAFRGGLAHEKADGIIIAFSTQPDHLAADGAGRNSPFTAALLKHLPTSGLDARVTFARVRGDVFAATGGEQRPEVSDSLIGEFLFKR